MYYYLECGLDNVYLVNGYPFPACIDELHAAIGKLLVQKAGSLDALEIRFLRHEMGMTQKALGEKLGVCCMTVCQWEKGRNRVKPNQDVSLRTLYLEFIGCPCSRALLFRVMSGIDDDPWLIILECHHRQWFLSPRKKIV